MSRAEVESRPRTQNNSRLRADFSRTDPLQVKDRNVGAKYQGHRRKCSPKNKKRFSEIFRAISKKKQKGLRKVSARFLAFFKKILTIQTIALSSAENRAIFEDLRLRGQGQELDLRGQGLQNVSSRPRTSLRTPPRVIFPFQMEQESILLKMFLSCCKIGK